MSVRTMTPDEVRTRGFDALKRELGPVGFIKFMHQFERGQGDYTRDRREILDKLTVDDFVDDIRKHRDQKEA